MEHNNEAKLKERNSIRLTDSKKGLAITKSERLGWIWKGKREEGIEGYYDWYKWCGAVTGKTV